MQGISLGQVQQPQGMPIDLSTPLITPKGTNPVTPAISNPQTTQNVPQPKSDATNFNKAIGLAKAIRENESNGDFNAQGKSGEYGAYQFMPGTWKSWASEILGDSSADITNPINQNKVASLKIKQWLDSGMTPEQVAAKWNSGDENNWQQKVSTGYGGTLPPNSAGVEFNVPGYVNNVVSIYNKKYSNDNFANNVDKARQKGLSDTDILSKISANSQDYSKQYDALKAKGLDDTDALNTMALSYSGAMLTVQSKAPEQVPQQPGFFNKLDKEIVGLGKAGTNIALNMAAPIYDLPNNIATLFNGGKDIYTPLGQTKLAQEEATNREGEKVGRAIGEGIQFLAPILKSEKAVKVVQGALSEAPKIIQKGAGLLTRMGTEAINAGATTSLQGNVKQAGTNAAIGAVLPILGEVINGAKGLLQKVIPATTNVPREIMERFVSNPTEIRGLIKQGTTGEDALSVTRNAVKNLRTKLSNDWEKGVDALETKFEGKTMGMNQGQNQQLNNIIQNYGDDVLRYHEILPDGTMSEHVIDPNNMTFRDVINLNKNLNGMSMKPNVINAPQGNVVASLSKNFKGAFKDIFNDEDVSNLLQNYGAKKGILDSADHIVSSGNKNNPIKDATALRRIQTIYDSNKGAYLSAIKDLEKETGYNIQDHIAATKLGRFLPEKASTITAEGLRPGKIVTGMTDKIFDVLLSPITSPKLSKYVYKATTSPSRSELGKIIFGK